MTLDVHFSLFAMFESRNPDRESQNIRVGIRLDIQSRNPFYSPLAHVGNGLAGAATRTGWSKRAWQAAQKARQLGCVLLRPIDAIREPRLLAQWLLIGMRNWQLA
jgi:hypothetical protein